MIGVELMYRWACETPIGKIVPKQIRDRVYVEYIRELTRRWITKTLPDEIYSTTSIKCDPASHLKVWIVSSSQDLTMAFWCLKSLLHYSNETWSVNLAASDDLNFNEREHLENHFPGIQVFQRVSLDAASTRALLKFPFCHWLRHTRNYVPSIKLFDPIVSLDNHPFLLIDSDVLFFEHPTKLLRAFEKSENGDTAFQFNIEPTGKLNSGLGVINPRYIELSDIEDCLSAMNMGQLNSWTTEQDVYASLAKGRSIDLPSEYAVQPTEEHAHENLTSCHYIGVCRHRFYSQGIKRLREQAFMGIKGNQ